MKKTRPEARPYKEYDHLDDAYKSACSQTECTGLIAHAPLTEEEYESYMDIYDFGPPIVTEKSAEDGNGPAFGSDITADNII